MHILARFSLKNEGNTTLENSPLSTMHHATVCTALADLQGSQLVHQPGKGGSPLTFHFNTMRKDTWLT